MPERMLLPALYSYLDLRQYPPYEIHLDGPDSDVDDEDALIQHPPASTAATVDDAVSNG